MMITKIEAAEKEIDTAIKLFFENIDHISAYVLAAEALEVTNDLCKKDEDEIYRSELARLGCPQKVRLSFRYEMQLHIKPEYLKDAFKSIRKDQNFLKHADRDHDRSIQEISIEKLIFLIFWAVQNFRLLENRITIAMSIFLLWFAASNQKYLSSNADSDFLDSIGKIKDLLADPKSEQSFRLMYRSLQVNAPKLFMA